MKAPRKEAMNFLLIRHADALPIEESRGMEDADRPLTDKGLAQCQALSATLKRGGVALGKVLSSPYLRPADGRGTAQALDRAQANPGPL